MARIIDLDTLTAEPIQFIIGGNTYEIPGNPSTELTIQFMGFQEKNAKIKDPKAKVELLGEMVATLLNQDQNHEVNTDFVLKNFSLSQMKKITEVFMDTVRGIESNPNS